MFPSQNFITSMMDETVKIHKINFIRSTFNFASDEEIDIALQDCKGDEILALYKMSFSMYLENIRKIIKERQSKMYLNWFISNEQKNVEETAIIPTIFTEMLTYSSSSSSPTTTTSLISPTLSILPTTSNTNDEHPPGYDNRQLFRNVYPDELQKKGKWSDDEDILFMKRLEEFGRDGPWGGFSLAIPGRNGYQCRDHYKMLIKRGRIKSRKFCATKFSNDNDINDISTSVDKKNKRMRR